MMVLPDAESPARYVPSFIRSNEWTENLLKITLNPFGYPTGGSHVTHLSSMHNSVLPTHRIRRLQWISVSDSGIILC